MEGFNILLSFVKRFLENGFLKFFLVFGWDVKLEGLIFICGYLKIYFIFFRKRSSCFNILVRFLICIGWFV